jgi:hypothetical protein
VDGCKGGWVGCLECVLSCWVRGAWYYCKYQMIELRAQIREAAASSAFRRTSQELLRTPRVVKQTLSRLQVRAKLHRHSICPAALWILGAGRSLRAVVDLHTCAVPYTNQHLTHFKTPSSFDHIHFAVLYETSLVSKFDHLDPEALQQCVHVLYKVPRSFVSQLNKTRVQHHRLY